MKIGFHPRKYLNPVPFLEERLDTWSTLQKALLYVLTFCALGGAFYFLKYKPMAEGIHNMRRQVATLEKRVATLKHIESEIEPFRKQLAASRADFEHLMSLLPDKKEIPDLLEKISRIGAQEGLENLLFQPQGEQSHDFYATIPLRLDVIGSYHRLGRFLDKVSKLDRIIKVTNLNMARHGNTKIKINCTMQTYRFLEQKETSEKQKAKAKK